MGKKLWTEKKIKHFGSNKMRVLKMGIRFPPLKDIANKILQLINIKYVSVCFVVHICMTSISSACFCLLYGQIRLLCEFMHEAGFRLIYIFRFYILSHADLKKTYQNLKKTIVLLSITSNLSTTVENTT